MNAERFRELVDAYGADSRRWPAGERVAMEAFRAAQPQAESWLREAKELDAWLDGDTVTPRDLSRQILGALPPSLAEGIIAWLLPSTPSLWWRPAVAAVLPMVLGVAIGVATAVPTPMDWAEEERALLSAASGETWYD
jgi:hypothetical protein